MYEGYAALLQHVIPYTNKYGAGQPPWHFGLEECCPKLHTAEQVPVILVQHWCMSTPAMLVALYVNRASHNQLLYRKAASQFITGFDMSTSNGT